MQKGQQAVLGAILALPFLCAAGNVSAAPPPGGGQYVYVPPGATVVVLPGPAMTAPLVNTLPAPMASPLVSMIAEQDAMMRRMIATMNAMSAMPMPDPERVLAAAMRGVPQPGRGTGVFLTSVSSGRGVCSETITYNYPANGGRPQVHVARRGDGCGAVTMQGPATPAAAPFAPRAIPSPAPRGAPPRVWTARDSARPIGPAAPGA